MTQVRRTLSLALAFALVALSPGLEAHRAFAQMVEAPVARPTLTAPVSVSVNAGMLQAPAALPTAASGLGLPAPLATRVPAKAALARVAPAAARVAPAGGVAAARTVAAAARPVAAAMAKRTVAAARAVGAAGPASQATGESAVGLGNRVFSALFGGDLRSAAEAVAPGAQEPTKPSGLESAAPAAARPDSEPASPAPASLDKNAWKAEAKEYAASRKTLAKLAAAFGLAFSLPVAGPALSRRLVDEAGTKRVVFSDFDDTLDKFNSVASPETVGAITGVLGAGKTVVVITDRPDTKKPGSKSVTILESLESIPAESRAGLWVAANKGGRVLRYDAKGEAQLVYEEPAIPAEEAAKVKEAADAVRARLGSLGAEVHDGSKNIPSENASPYGYALMLKIGSQEAQVKAVAGAFQEELGRRGVSYEVEPRLAKDPAFPPYVTFSKLDKSLAVRRVAELLKAKAGDSVILGDSMYAPKPRVVAGQDEKSVEEARELGEKLSGRPALLTGNGTDRDMEKGLPGALTLSVGGTADPAIAYGFVLPGKGPAVTRAVLESVAQGRRLTPPAEESADIPAWAALPIIAAMVGAAAFGWYMLYSGFARIIESGGPFVPTAPGGWESLFSGALLLGMMGSVLIPSRDLPDPNEVYATAYRAAMRRQAEAFGAAEPLRLAQATGVMPARDGQAWHFTFIRPQAEGARPAASIAPASAGTAELRPARLGDLIDVDVSRGIAALGAYETRERAFRQVPVPEATPFSGEPYLVSMGVKLSPAQALNEILRQSGAAKGGWSVQLRVDEEPVSGDKDFWYHFYGADRHVAVNARTGEYRAYELPEAGEPGQPGGLWSRVKRAVNSFVAPYLANWMRSGGAQAVPDAVTDEDILAAARSVVTSKGYPWSQTEYNVGLYTTADSLRQHGATEAQMKLYFDACAAAPIRGGRFNPWSGD